MRIDIVFESPDLIINSLVNSSESITYTLEFGTWLGGGTVGTTDYDKLQNKPKINNIPLSGNKTSKDLGLQPIGSYPEDELSNEDIHNILKR